VHLIEVGDGAPGPVAEVKPAITEDAVTLSLGGRTFAFSKRKPFAVSAVEP